MDLDYEQMRVNAEPAWAWFSAAPNSMDLGSIQARVHPELEI